MVTIADLLAYSSRLQTVSDTALLDTELLLAHCLDNTRTFLKAWPDKTVDPIIQVTFEDLFARRLAGEPIAYILGRQGFWSLDLQVNTSTLIPRPETELLVEKALALFRDRQDLSVLDLGTGTGAIALSLASENPSWQITGCDKAPKAIALAEQNRQQLLPNNSHVVFLESDWFSAIPSTQFDLIITNPPYIDGDDPHLSRGDVRFEPVSALVADGQGLADIDSIIQQAPNFLVQGGWLLIEHGYQQAAAVTQRLAAAGFSQVFTDHDLAGLDRVSGGCFNENTLHSLLDG